MEQFKKSVEDYLMDKYLITVNDITSDEQIEQAFKDGESVDEFCDYLADKYDLIKFNV